MDATASSFSTRSNAKRAAEQMIAKGTAPAVDYGIKPNNGRFEVVWKTALTAAKFAETATSGEPALSEPAPVTARPMLENKWPKGTRVMVRQRKSWREATISVASSPIIGAPIILAAAPACSRKPISGLTTRSAM
jgi:hypothetical protein